MASCKIGTKSIGEGSPVFIIAEAGINHDGKLSQAFELIDAASEVERGRGQVPNVSG